MRALNILCMSFLLVVIGCQDKSQASEIANDVKELIQINQQILEKMEKLHLEAVKESQLEGASRQLAMTYCQAPECLKLEIKVHYKNDLRQPFEYTLGGFNLKEFARVNNQQVEEGKVVLDFNNGLIYENQAQANPIKGSYILGKLQAEPTSVINYIETKLLKRS